jgi:flagellar basal-body rod protein FlgB
MVDRVADKFEHYMDLLSTRQKLVTSNIANADTPGYKARDIDFQFEFQSQVENSRPNVYEAPDLPSKNDGNNVNMDSELRLLSENALRFQLAATLARDEIRGIQSAIQEGKNG